MGRNRWVSPVVAAVMLVFALWGCLGQEGVEENRRQIAAQQELLAQQQKQIVELQAQGGVGTSYSPAKPCEESVRQRASRRGAGKFAAHDYAAALGYFQDALTACPSSPQAEFDVARAFDALGERAQARTHYRRAAKLAGAADATIAEQARAALTRLGR